MSENTTANLDLPLLMPAQAQKHVTVNDALLRLDGQVDLLLQSISRTNPPAAAADGLCWAVPQGATGAWQGQTGRIAIVANGGWVFITARQGRRAMIADQGVTAIFSGTDWVAGALNLGTHGSGLVAMQNSVEVQIGTGASVETGLYIPPGALVLGVTSKVKQAVSGTLTSWQVGTNGAEGRFGQGLGKAEGSWGRGILSAPMTYWNLAQVLLTATGGQFTGGRVRLVAHWLELRIPD